MRRLVIVLLFCGISLPAFAAKPVTIEQFEARLRALTGKSDADLAWQIADLQLTERLSKNKATQIEKNLPGDGSKRALQALADTSAFEDPPADELPKKSAPDLQEQKRIMGLMVGYVGKTIPLLPNFIATRNTDHFEDTPILQFAGAPFMPFQPIHFVGSSSATVTYSNGRDVATPVALKGRKPEPEPQGLQTWGVFGPILGTVLVDAAQSTLAWERWEEGTNGPVAVFRFAVPKAKSHYEVNYCCVADPASTRPNGVPFRQKPGYHGELAVDPSTGAVVRLKVEAELNVSDPVSDAAILVEYGQVEIGGKSYICPTRSLSRSHEQEVQVDPVYHIPVASQMQPVKLSLNVATFRDYHVFRSETRVVSDEASLGTERPEAADSAAPAAQENADAPTRETRPETNLAKDTTTVIPAAPAVQAAAGPMAAAPVAAQGNATDEREVRLSVADDLLADSAPEATAHNFTIRTTTRLVDIAVVAYDKKGRPVTGLKPGDLEVFDNGRKQEIRSFGAAGREASAPSPSAAAAATEAAEPEFTNLAHGGTRLQITGATVLLIDTGNLAFGDWTHAREEMLRFLKTVPADEPVGLYVLRSRGFSILMEPRPDHARLAETLTKWMPTAQDLAQAQGEEGRNRQDIEYVHSISDLFYVNGNVANGQYDSRASTDPQLRTEGSNPERDALASLPALARHLASISGHKSLVWVASDNVLADWTDQAPSEDKSEKTVTPAVLRAQEALNDAHVSIYPLDASQLEAGGVNAGQSQGNVQLVPTADARIQTAIEGGETPQDKADLSDLLEKSKHNIYPGRVTAQMKQDLHPIAAEYQELAQATGGRVFRRSSDLAAEMEDAVDDGRAAYLLTFAPDTQPDDAYHHITVKLTGGRERMLRYRTGYLYAKEPETMKDRIRQAIWQPGDMREIGVTATPANDAGTMPLKLTVDATDLALAQQDGRWMDKLDVLLVERDDAALKAKINGQTAALRLQPGTYQTALRDGLTVTMPAAAAPEGGVLRVIVIDENTGRIGTVTVPGAATGGAKLAGKS